MFIFKIILFILEIVLLINLVALGILESEGHEGLYEEELDEFYEKYVISNTLFPVEYRSDISQINKIIEMIKENPEKYKDIPMDDVSDLDILIKFGSGDEKLKKKHEQISIFIAMTLCAYIVQMYLMSKYLPLGLDFFK